MADQAFQDFGALVETIDVGPISFTMDFVDATPVFVPPDGPPTVQFSPVAGGAIAATDALTVLVQPTVPSSLVRVMLLVQFPTLNLYEVAFDGEGFSQAYPAALGNARTVDGDGFTFTLLRAEGWPASPRVVPVAVDNYGNVNPVSSETYAWTLI